MIAIESIYNAATDMLYGEKAPSVKLALMFAAMSKNQPLEPNGKQARILARYANTRLPSDKDALFEELKAARGVLYWSHIESLYFIDLLWSEGLLEGLEHIGETRQEQIDWRHHVKTLMNKRGMGYKTISMAAFILSPLTCELMPVDRWVKRYCGLNGHNSPQLYNPYEKVENQVIQMRNLDGYENVPLVLYHWKKWEEARQDEDKSKVSQGLVESHKRLSCRWY